MKRGITITLLFLLLGTIVNVAVAWSCALWSIQDEMHSDYTYDHSFDPPNPPAELAHLVPEDWCELSGGWDSINSGTEGTARSFGFEAILFGVTEHIPGESKFGVDRAVFRHSCGVPCFALRCTGEIDDRSALRNTLDALQAPSFLKPRRVNEIPLPGWTFEFPPYQCVLPLRPIWPGFAINTLFYALTLWLLCCGPFTLRRFIRRRRNRCIKCNYDLRGAPTSGSGCPECGWERDQPVSETG